MTAPEVHLDVFPALYPAGGIGRYTRDLADALATRPGAPPARFSYPRHAAGARVPDWDPARLRPLPIGSRRMRAVLLASARLGLRPDRLYGRPAVFHSPTGWGPRFRDTRIIVTIHDLTGILHPEWHPARTRWLVGQTLPRAVRHAERVLCDSDHVRAQVVRELGARPDRVETVHLGVNGAFHPRGREERARHLARRFAITDPFVLHVGTIEPRKNHGALVRAFERLRRAGFPGRLVLVGRVGWGVEPILRVLGASPEAGRIVRIEEADDEDLAMLYSACEMFVFPSFEEGFGLPPIEAMACGAPVITSDGSSLREIAEGAAVLVDPADRGALEAAMVDLWSDPARRDQLRAVGLERAARFGAGAWIERMFSIYREELGRAGTTDASRREAAK
jgi:glycosyltransferase involved in cell wall biosynthesis